MDPVRQKGLQVSTKPPGGTDTGSGNGNTSSGDHEEEGWGGRGMQGLHRSCWQGLPMHMMMILIY